VLQIERWGEGEEWGIGGEKNPADYADLSGYYCVICDHQRPLREDILLIRY